MTDWHAFADWLRRQGAEVLAPTNPYEVARFRARGGTHVVYRTQRGKVTAAEFPAQCIQVWSHGGDLDMGIAKTQRDFGAKYRAALFERDGRACFYCLEEMPNDDMTLEHLVPLQKGGPNHLDNMALAHRKCNQEAGNLPLAKKIGMRTLAVVNRMMAAVRAGIHGEAA